MNIDAKLKSLNIRLVALKSEIAYYTKLKQTEYAPNQFETAYQNLSDTQRKIVQDIFVGADISALCCIYEISTKGVKWHLTKIYAAFGVSGSKQLKEVLNANKENYEQISNGLCVGPAPGSEESCIRRLHSGPKSNHTSVSLPFGKSTKGC